MAKDKIIVCIIATVLAAFITDSQAAMRYWSEATLDAGQGVMTLPKGHYWPVVTTGYGWTVYDPRGSAATYFLGPSGFTRSGGGGSNIFSGPNGEIGIVSSNQIQVLHNDQWAFLSGSVPGQFEAGAFDSQGGIHAVSYDVQQSIAYYSRFTSRGWVSLELCHSRRQNSGGLDIAVDDSGVVSILVNNIFISQNVPGGAFSQVQLPGEIMTIDLDVSNNGIPGVIGRSDNALKYLTFDIQQQQWTSDILSSNFFGPAAVCFDNFGNPAVTYLANSIMHFAINDGGGTGWLDSIIDADQISCVTDTSLAFDPDNNPVVCFGTVGDTRIYYDPIVVPEPLAALLLLAGAWGIRRARRS